MECFIEVHLIDASCVAPHPSLREGHVSYQECTSSLFAEASSARDWGDCVLDQSAQNSALGSRTLVHGTDRSTRLLG